MPSQYLLGVDIGTYSSKGVLVDAASGEVIAEHAIEHGIEMPKPGWAEHDADAVWWGEFVQISRALIEKSGVEPKSHYLCGDQRFRSMYATGRRRWQTLAQSHFIWH